jgi:hypothetical protein
MVELGLLVPTSKLNRNGNRIFNKTAKAKAMSEDDFATAFEVACVRSGFCGPQALLADAEKGKSS